jgi:hypothetical protein
VNSFSRLRGGVSRVRATKAVRYLTILLSTVIALLAAAVVVSVTVDLGPAARREAERLGTNYIERPLHIGTLRIRLLTGRVLLEDVRIDGLKTDDRPFFTAKQIAVSLDWAPAFARKPDIVITSLEMTDWQMLVEKWADAHNFPKFGRDRPKPTGPRPLTVTLRWLRASRGQFAYEDHDLPWSIICPNLTVDIGNLPKYHGTATFSGGTVAIQQFVPMWIDMKTARFAIDGPRIQLDRIDFDTDGAKTVASGVVDTAHWPEQIYQVRSQVQFPRMRELFFKSEPWNVTGAGDFTGTFHLSKAGPDLAGTFASDLASVNAYRFPSLYGSLRWTKSAFDVWDAGSQFYGGDAKFTYSLKPLGAQVRPTHRFDATLAGVDLEQFTDFEELPGLRFAGTASMRNVLEWPAGRFSEHRGEGQIFVAPPSGVSPMPPALTAARAAGADRTRREVGRFAPMPLAPHLPIAGDVTYRYGPDDVTFDGGRFATERTHVTFEGSTAWGERSRIAFHVTSRDWQESDQVLAGIITDFGAPTGPVPFGGRGEFDGVMLGPFRNPRVEGTFSGDELRAFDTLWGGGSGRIVFENKYVNVTGGHVRLGDSEIFADGRFSTGYPREDRGEEIDARFRVVRRDLDSLRHAFQIDDYSVSGAMSGEFHLTGQ